MLRYSTDQSGAEYWVYEINHRSIAREPRLGNWAYSYGCLAAPIYCVAGQRRLIDTEYSQPVAISDSVRLRGLPAFHPTRAPLVSRRRFSLALEVDLAHAPAGSSYLL